MRFALRGGVGVALFVAVVACRTSAEGEGEGDAVLIEMGAPEYRSHCASCHGLSGRGDGPVAATLKRGPSDLTRIAARRGGRFPDAEVARFIDGRFHVPAHGTREMPIWGQSLASDIPESELAESVARGKIAVLVEYLKSIQRPLVAGD